MPDVNMPNGNRGSDIRSKIERLARFAFAYLSVYQPMLKDNIACKRFKLSCSVVR